MSEESLPVSLPEGRSAAAVTVANVREEKNSSAAGRGDAAALFRGLRFRWVNIGSLANAPLVESSGLRCGMRGLKTISR